MSNKFIDGMINSQIIVGGTAFVTAFIYGFNKSVDGKREYTTGPLSNPLLAGLFDGLITGSFAGLYFGLYPITYPTFVVNRLYNDIYTDNKTPLQCPHLLD